jgi:hypothetical protein
MPRQLILAAALLAATPASAQFADLAPVADEELHAIAGRADLNEVTQRAEVRNTSTVSNNSVNGTSVTGTINFDGSALQNMTGLSVFSANTGNNVSINAAMNVNVAITN